MRGDKVLSGERVASMASHIDTLIVVYNLIISGSGSKRNPNQMKSRINMRNGKSSTLTVGRLGYCPFPPWVAM